LRHTVIFINKSDKDEKFHFLRHREAQLSSVPERVFPGIGETPCTERGWEKGKGRQGKAKEEDT